MKVYIKLKYNSGFKINTDFNKSSNRPSLGKLSIGSFVKKKNIESRALLYNILLSYSTFDSSALRESKVSSLDISKPSIFIKKSSKSVYTVLRAPYRYKKGRYQIGRQLYIATVSFCITVGNDLIADKSSDLVQVTSIVRVMNNYLSSFSTNLSTLSNLTITIPFNNPDALTIRNYKAAK